MIAGRSGGVGWPAAPSLITTATVQSATPQRCPAGDPLPDAISRPDLAQSTNVPIDIYARAVETWPRAGIAESTLF